MAEIPQNLAQGVLASAYTAGSGTMTVTPSASPFGSLPTSGTFSVIAVAPGGAAGAIYTVTAVAAAGGNQVLTLGALEFGADVGLVSGSSVANVMSLRSLTAFISQLAAGAAFHDAETPSGTVNGTNVTFTLAATPSPVASLHLYLNGVLQIPTVDFTISAATITFTVAPTTTSSVIAFYRS